VSTPSYSLVEELDVAAERDRGDHPFGAVATATQPERPAEADREAQHADAETPPDPVVAELMESDEYPEADDQPPDRTEEFLHHITPGTAGRCRPHCR
jgi:hypothetical protein